MQRSAQRRSPAALRKRRVLAVGAVVVVVGGLLTVTQISNASTFGFFGSRHHHHHRPSSSCPTEPRHHWNTQRDLATSRDGVIENHAGDGQVSASEENALRERLRRHRCRPSDDASSPADDSTTSPGTGGDEGGDDNGGTGDRTTVPPGGADGNNNGLQVLGRDCTNSNLPVHDGFQSGGQCSETMFGEVPEQAKGASLLITDHPDEVNLGEAFSFTVSTRNVQRDRFLGAGAGGYYLESSFLNEDGIVRGHFHSGCQLLQSTDEAPTPDRAQFFVATEDGGGGTTPDTVTINVPGDALTVAGTYRCASWAGDGSHRVPMMQFANQIPAFDSFRLVVR